MFVPFKKLAFTTGSNAMTSAIVGVSLVAVGTAIYLSPGGPGNVAAAGTAPTQAQGYTPITTSAGRPSPTASATGSTSAAASPSATAKPPAANAAPHIITVKETVTKSATVTAKIMHCADFQWQQDAQATYLANLSDPGALDGATGPSNGDGIACNQLAVDPARPASVAVGAYVPPTPTPAQKASLVAPTTKYFGVTQNGLPGDASMFNSIATDAGKVPSQVSWFAGFDSDYRSDLVTAAWNRGALPMITWMSMAADSTSGHSDSEYTLTHILNHDLDAYLYKYAADIARTNLPVVIRFDHEMNGNWYPWSAGMYNNTPAKYVQVWQYIWNIFQGVGANKEVIWLWAPSRIDNLKPHASTGGGVGQTNLAEDYPGDQYVDWVGASMYLRNASQGPTYAATFGKTVTALEALTAKPVFIPETGAIQTDVATKTDQTALKTTWIANALAGFLADPRIIGFSWFNNVAVNTSNGTPISNDWRFQSSPAALAAFKAAIDQANFASGTMPDGGP